MNYAQEIVMSTKMFTIVKMKSNQQRLQEYRNIIPPSLF